MSGKRMLTRMAGVTLVELIIAIVIVSAALAGLVAAFTRANLASADPVVTQQMVAIAESMMEEVMLKPYEAAAGGTGADRAQYNDIWDFNNLPAKSSVTDVGGGAIAGLERYSVTVTVEQLPGGSLTGIAATGDAARVRVTVRNGDDSFVLTGWRTRL